MICAPKTNICIFVTLGVLNVVFSANILGIFPGPLHSHRKLYTALVKELLNKGHDITIISPFEENFSSKNGSFDSIAVSTLQKYLQGTLGQTYSTPNYNAFQALHLYTPLALKVTETILAHEEVQQLLKSKKKFDVIIMIETMNYAHKAIATHFGAPLVLFSTMGASYWFNSLVGNPAPPSYVPDLMSGYYGQMSLLEKLVNSVFYIYMKIYFQLYVFPKHDQMIKKYIPGGLDIEQVMYNISKVLVNSHYSINQPTPYVPMVADIGGLHIKPAKKLPTDLQQYLDDAKDGVIYFSMGSNLKGSEIPHHKRLALLETFAKLKKKILWKFEEDFLPGKPPNVRIEKWLPQQDVLAHPNIKLFITHGGALSMTESVYHGVPVLVLPIYGDQMLNAKIAVSHGFGLSVLFDDITEMTLTQIIDQLLKNTKYTTESKFRSRIFRARMDNPLGTATYWVEYVIRNKGAKYFKVVSLDMSLPEYLLLDVILLLVLIFLLISVVLYFLCFVLKYVCK